MCFILSTYYLTDTHITRLMDEWDGNPHGAGLGYIEKDASGVRTLFCQKGFMTKQSLAKRLRKLRGHTVVCHLRFATHGDKTQDNCHPFWSLQGEALLFHNGMFHGPWGASLEHSDSKLFAETMNNLSMDEVEISKADIEHFIGHNKVVILHKSGYITILNEDLGEWWSKGGTWVSKPSPHRWFKGKDGKWYEGVGVSKRGARTAPLKLEGNSTGQAKVTTNSSGQTVYSVLEPDGTSQTTIFQDRSPMDGTSQVPNLILPK